MDNMGGGAPPLERTVIHGPLLVQMGGKGEFWRMHVELKDAVLTLTHVARGGGVIATAAIPPGCSIGVRNPKSMRTGQSEHCFRVDLPTPDNNGIKKYIVDPESGENRRRWEQGLSGRVSDMCTADVDTMAGAQYQVVTRTHVQKDLEEDSARVGTRLGIGEVINALERALCSSGVPRVRCDRGWITETERSGVMVLRLLDQERWQTQHLRPKESVSSCSDCYAAFGVFKRPHNCHRCGEVFCAACTATTMPLPQLGHTEPQRMCTRCAESQLSLVEAVDTSGRQASTSSPVFKRTGGLSSADRPGFLDKMDTAVRAQIPPYPCGTKHGRSA
jgi:hypothetical protein